MPTPFDPQLVLARPLMANLATVTPDGAPRNAPVWFAWENSALWMLSDATSSSAARVISNPQVAVEIVDYDNAAGVLRHLGLRGEASVEPMNTALFRRLLRRYLGPEDQQNEWFIKNVARVEDPAGRLIRLVPSSIFTNDVSFFRTGPALAQRNAR
ncbi:pyridoxamine 5'-phosphate oxidase family protein [Rhodobacteraceae bacterium N5(2021)]|uniref:Pyridoxamine 5'-phosphate oxidase family protein n=1 Tax=Gymnodinialimonas phycosphaerae TaxID=2841589 RepID=A0A975TU01_9RHOB|nr:pyridoxamine 5'-phosphate oxidase family protein [Gymnodinialimonas phycosphaerae]MBY4894589.1 pyridoxamine 5'-phosphate oxidase family protein [Gymnodinialimonas phycosphaerae]